MHECLNSKVIRIGYEELGDLTQYPGINEIRSAVSTAYPEMASNGVTRLANDLAQFRDLEPGSRVVANHGQTKILAVGTVVGDGYCYDEELPAFRHTVSVEWDTSLAQKLQSPLVGHVGTFYKVGSRLWQQIIGTQEITHTEGPASQADPDSDMDTAPVLPEGLHDLLHLIERKGAVILTGPPGTGKTRLAFDAALAMTGRPLPADATAEQRQKAVATLLQSEQVVLATFHPTYGYEDFVEGFKPAETGSGGLRLERRDGLFIQLCRSAAKEPDLPYVLIIDEINRADLPRVLGELITVLEKDKRGIPVTLPVSSAAFAIPPNVFLIGTMNTADRSVSHLDSAVRRRFGFYTVAPKPELIAGTVGALDLELFLRQLNIRVRQQFGNAYEVGHAFLLRDDQPLASEEDLHSVYYHDILPLLEELTLDDAGQLGALLGSLLDADSQRPRSISVDDLPEELSAAFEAAYQPDHHG